MGNWDVEAKKPFEDVLMFALDQGNLEKNTWPGL
jgi:hypothetical protein